VGSNPTLSANCILLLRGRNFVTDDREGYHRVIPPDQLFTSKDLTFPIEQDNSNVRHYLARFRRKTKVVSKCQTMVDLSLRLLHALQEPANYASCAKTFCSILWLELFKTPGPYQRGVKPSCRCF